MTVKTLGPYDFPAKDRQSNFGDDQLVHVVWEGNLFFCSPACFRVPRSMPWSAFTSQIVEPWASADPDYDVNRVTDWRIDDQAIEPGPDDTLAGLGVAHKGLLRFRLT